MARTQKLKQPATALNTSQIAVTHDPLPKKMQQVEQRVALPMDALAKSDAQQMEMLHKAAEMIDISPDSLHLAFNRFFDQPD